MLHYYVVHWKLTIMYVNYTSIKTKKAIICKKKKRERENENICLEFTCPSRFLCIALKYEIKKIMPVRSSPNVYFHSFDSDNINICFQMYNVLPSFHSRKIPTIHLYDLIKIFLPCKSLFH